MIVWLEFRWGRLVRFRVDGNIEVGKVVIDDLL